MDLMQNYYLQNYIYSKSNEISDIPADPSLIEKWNRWHCAIMIESNHNLFDRMADPVEELKKELRVAFFFIQLNLRQQLLLFERAYCDYNFIASKLYSVLKRKYPVRIHIAVSRMFEGAQNLPEIITELEKLLEGKFYHPQDHVLTYRENYTSVGEEVMDSHLVQMISDDIYRKDVEALRKDFGILKEKYEKQNRSSLMYTKFIFSNVLQELYQGDFSNTETLSSEIDELYSCSELARILMIVERNVNVFCAFVETDMIRAREKVMLAITYMKEHVSEDLNAEMLGKQVGLPPGYLVATVRRETGMNLNRLWYVIRMETAKELLKTTELSAEEVGRAVGIGNAHTFEVLFQQYYGKKHFEDKKIQKNRFF